MQIDTGDAASASVENSAGADTQDKSTDKTQEQGQISQIQAANSQLPQEAQTMLKLLQEITKRHPLMTIVAYINSGQNNFPIS